MTQEQKIIIRNFILKYGVSRSETYRFVPYKDINLVLWCNKFLMYSDDTFKWLKGMSELEVKPLMEFIDAKSK